MIKLLLVCAAGMSSSMLLMRVSEAAKAQGIELVVDAIPYSSLSDYIENVDVVLLGLQLAHLERKVRKSLSEQGIAVGMMSVKDYGSMDGNKLLNQALKLKEEQNGKI